MRGLPSSDSQVCVAIVLRLNQILIESAHGSSAFYHSLLLIPLAPAAAKGLGDQLIVRDF